MFLLCSRYIDQRDKVRQKKRHVDKRRYIFRIWTYLTHYTSKDSGNRRLCPGAEGDYKDYRETTRYVSTGNYLAIQFKQASIIPQISIFMHLIFRSLVFQGKSIWIMIHAWMLSSRLRFYMPNHSLDSQHSKKLWHILSGLTQLFPVNWKVQIFRIKTQPRA